MDITIDNHARVEIFTILFQHMKLFAENMNIHFNKEEMFIQTMDNSHVSVLEFKLPKTWFSNYRVDEDTIIGVNTNILFKVLHTHEKSHALKMTLANKESDKLDISLVSSDTEVFDRHYVIPLVDIDSELMGIPDTEYQAELSLPSQRFSTLIDQMKLFGDTLTINCSEEKVEMSAESQESGKMFVEIPIDDLHSFSIDEEESLHLSFSLYHLKNICLYSKIAKDIDINMSVNYPIKLVYHLDDENAKAIFYLAPKIEDWKQSSLMYV